MRTLLAASLLAVAAQPAAAQVFIVPPDFSGPRVTGAEPGLGLPLPGATPEELNAALVWNLRAGLNVAALQCQGSAFLDAVDNYNQLLVNHNSELGPAYKALQAYFQRTAGKGAPGTKAFDDYNTKTYNGFSTLYAQNGFCHTAGEIGRELRFARRGQMADVAQRRMREFRNSLTFQGDQIWRTSRYVVTAPYINDFPANCYDKRRQVKKGCLKDSYIAPY